METSPGVETLSVLAVIIQFAIFIAIVVGLYYLTRRSKALRWILIGGIVLLVLTSFIAWMVFKDMGKGWAL